MADQYYPFGFSPYAADQSGGVYRGQIPTNTSGGQFGQIPVQTGFVNPSQLLSLPPEYNRIVEYLQKAAPNGPSDWQNGPQFLQMLRAYYLGQHKA